MCATACGRAAAKIEMLGIPTVTLTRTEFVTVTKNAVSGIGLSPDAAMVVFPIDDFLPQADITSVKTRKQEFYDGLTSWRSAIAQSAPTTSSMLVVEGASYEDALLKANHMFLTKRWGDGLPLWPATPERVNWVLRGSSLPRTHVIGKFPPRGGVTTIETCAIALVMAGGRPEYLPVLIAAVEACFDPAFNFEQLQATSGGQFPVVIVNGPIAKQIHLNSGFGCLGPDPQNPAGASIGRALRLMQQNVGGALPGIGTMASYGALRYTNVVVAEDEDGLPEDWESHASERHGYAAGMNSISLAFSSGAANIRRRSAMKETPEEDVVQGLHRMAAFMCAPNMAVLWGYENGAPGIMMISRVVARMMAKLGWTKSSIREFLWEHSKIPLEDLRRTGAHAWIEIDENPVVRASLENDPWPITKSPDNITIVVAGGPHPTNAYWLQGGPAVVGRTIRVPESFRCLLDEAEHDLGPPQ